MFLPCVSRIAGRWERVGGGWGGRGGEQEGTTSSGLAA